MYTVYERPQPPVDMVGNSSLELVFGIGVVIVMAGFLVYTARSWKSSGTAIGLCMLVGGMLASLTESFADFVGLLWFPTEGTLLPPLLHGFGVGVPWWVYIGYAWYLGGMPFIVYRQIQKGTTALKLARTGAIIALADVVLEVSGLNMGVYTYYGDQPFSFFGMPLWWSMAGGFVSIAMGSVFYKFRESFTGWRVLLAIPVLPSTYMMFLSFSTWPVWVALDSDKGYVATYLAALWAAGLVVLMFNVITKELGLKSGRGVEISTGSVASESSIED